MNTEQKEWRSIQIAATILYRHLGNISIEYSQNQYYDLLVNITSEADLRFGVVVKSSTFTSSQAFQHATNILAELDYSNQDLSLPIILMCVNEATESATFAFLICWNLGRPSIHKRVELRIANKENLELAKDVLKSMDNVIRILSVNNWNVLKTINLRKDIGNNREVSASLMYLRSFSGEYRMRQNKVVNEKEKMKRLLYGIPEEEYPSDILDELILHGVQRSYPDAKMKSRLILFSSEINDIQIISQYWKNDAEILIGPDLLSYDILVQQYARQFQCIKLPLQIYGDNKYFKPYFENEFFEAYSNVGSWVNDYSSVLNLAKTTLKPVSTLFY